MQRSLRVSFFAAVLAAVPCAAQYRPDPPPPAIGNDNDVGVNQLSKFGIYDALKARLKQWNKEGKSIAELLAEDKANAMSLVATLKLSCAVTNAVLVAVDDKAHTKTYEVACQNGAGYFLAQSDPPGKPSGFSCFAAEAARQADIAAHREPALTCSLPENAGSKTVAAAILLGAGKSCTIKDFKWRGQSATTDFLELACEEGPGFILRSPLPGSQTPLRIDTCSESSRSGVPCQLAGNDTILATFKDALAQHNVPCDAEAVRVIGHEAVKRRQVVEYFCPKQQPNGLVAFLPTEGSTEPFEVLDCASAAKRQVVCSLNKSN
jgi:hypothetical protein